MGQIPKLKMPFGLRIYVHSNDHSPAHVHVYLGNPDNYEAHVKINLDGTHESAEGFNASTVKKIVEFVVNRRNDIERYWNEMHPDKKTE